MTPEEIPVHSLTHLIFSFGFIAPGTFKIEPMSDFEPSMFGRVTDLKEKKPSLKVLIALGVSQVTFLEVLAANTFRVGHIMIQESIRKSSLTWPQPLQTGRSLSPT